MPPSLLGRLSVYLISWVMREKRGRSLAQILAGAEAGKEAQARLPAIPKAVRAKVDVEALEMEVGEGERRRWKVYRLRSKEGGGVAHRVMIYVHGGSFTAQVRAMSHVLQSTR